MNPQYLAFTAVPFVIFLITERVRFDRVHDIIRQRKFMITERVCFDRVHDVIRQRQSKQL